MAIGRRDIGNWLLGRSLACSHVVLPYRLIFIKLGQYMSSGSLETEGNEFGDSVSGAVPSVLIPVP